MGYYRRNLVGFLKNYGRFRYGHFRNACQSRQSRINAGTGIRHKNRILSFFLNEVSKHKQRIVIAGSHGKTSITSMILHVLKSLNRKFDYLVGARIEGFELMASLSDAPIIIIEGDEYLASRWTDRPNFYCTSHISP